MRKRPRPPGRQREVQPDPCAPTCPVRTNISKKRSTEKKLKTPALSPLIIGGVLEVWSRQQGHIDGSADGQKGRSGCHAEGRRRSAEGQRRQKGRSGWHGQWRSRQQGYNHLLVHAVRGIRCASWTRRVSGKVRLLSYCGLAACFCNRREGRRRSGWLCRARRAAGEHAFFARDADRDAGSEVGAQAVKNWLLFRGGRRRTAEIAAGAYRFGAGIFWRRRVVAPG
jgi:hypothetical protein